MWAKCGLLLPNLSVYIQTIRPSTVDLPTRRFYIFLLLLLLLPLWRYGPTQAMASSFMRFLDHTQRRIAVGRTPLDE